MSRLGLWSWSTSATRSLGPRPPHSHREQGHETSEAQEPGASLLPPARAEGSEHPLEARGLFGISQAGRGDTGGWGTEAVPARPRRWALGFWGCPSGLPGAGGARGEPDLQGKQPPWLETSRGQSCSQLSAEQRRPHTAGIWGGDAGGAAVQGAPRTSPPAFPSTRPFFGTVPRWQSVGGLGWQQSPLPALSSPVGSRGALRDGSPWGRRDALAAGRVPGAPSSARGAGFWSGSLLDLPPGTGRDTFGHSQCHPRHHRCPADLGLPWSLLLRGPGWRRGTAWGH